MDIFKRPKFPPRPANYIPGIGRGAVPFFTRSDVGAADPNMNPTFNTRGHEHDKEEIPESLFDKWTGYKEKAKTKKLEQEDLEADEAYEGIQEYMDERNKRASSIPIKLPTKRRQLTPGEILADLKPELAKVTEDQWANLPEAKSFIKKKKKKQVYHPSSDSTILSAYNDSALTAQSSSLVIREKLLASSMARSQTSSFQSVDPEGYLTHLDTLDSSNQEIQDLRKLRSLFKSLLATNPKQPKTWLALSRLEEKAGNLKVAKDLMKEACSACPDSEDIWIEAARLETPVNARALLTKASEVLPGSSNIWILLASKENSKPGKVLILKRALERNSESVKLWKELVSHCSDLEALKFLQKAVICAPHSVDLWLALAKLESYKAARKTLNDARKQLPFEPSIWIAAAKLEETQGNLDNVSEMIKRGIKTLTNSAIAIDRKVWLQEVVFAEKSGSILTAKAILKYALALVVDESSKNLCLEELEFFIQEQAIESARFFSVIVLENDPNFKKMWKKAFEIEKKYGNISKAKEVLKAACSKFKESGKLWLSLLHLVDENELNDCVCRLADIEGVSEKVLLELFRVLMEKNRFDIAQDILEKSIERKKSPKIYRKLISFYVKMNDLSRAKSVQEKSLEIFPDDPVVYKYISRVFPTDQARQTLLKIQQAHPEEPQFWIYLSELELSCNNPIKCRFFLEQGRSKCASPLLYIKSIEFELKYSQKSAELLCNIALQQFKKVGKIWSLAIELADKKEKKSKIADAFQHCTNDLDLYLVVAKLFSKERKSEKARIWFEKCLKIDENFGDVWIFYYQLEKMTGNQENLEVIENRIQKVQIRKGKIWKSIVKENGRMENVDILRESFKKLDRI